MGLTYDEQQELNALQQQATASLEHGWMEGHPGQVDGLMERINALQDRVSDQKPSTTTPAASTVTSPNNNDASWHDGTRGSDDSWGHGMTGNMERAQVTSLKQR